MNAGMSAPAWFRPIALLLVLLFAACASEQPTPPASLAPLDFSYLPPLDLNVATLDVQSRYVPAGPPDVSEHDPAPPVAALRLMATQRLKPVGTAGRAVFAIDDAALVRSGDTVTGAFSVTLNIYTSAGVRAGFAQATVTRQITGVGDDLPAALYTLTRQLMQQMNVEFEFQVRRSLHDWLVAAGPPALQQARPPSPPPLVTSPGLPPAPSYAPPSPTPSPTPYYAPPPAATPPATAPEPELPYSLPPAGPLPQPTTTPPPLLPPLPSPLPSAGTLPPPTTAPPPPSPPLPAPLPPPGPVQD